MSFSKTVITWYLHHKRNLPWRNTKNPYYIWLSEIILQQTRVEQGKPYYLKFVDAFPTVHHLANASEESVLKLWQGLGYYSRARNLHTTAKVVAFKQNGTFPNTYDSLLKLKGVGDYTASAIASICFNEATPVVDGNVYRVLARYFGVEIPINSPKGKKHFKGLAEKLIDKKNPSTYNQAIMEFGALQCKPKNPDCGICPLQKNCVAFTTNKIAVLPIKIKNTTIKKRYFNYFVFTDIDDKTLLQQRTKNDIWKNLYEFPLLESDKELTLAEVGNQLKKMIYIDAATVELQLFNPESIVHKLSHQHIYTKFWTATLQQKLKNGVAISKIEKYPVSVLIQKFISTYPF